MVYAKVLEHSTFRSAEHGRDIGTPTRCKVGLLTISHKSIQESSIGILNLKEKENSEHSNRLKSATTQCPMPLTAHTMLDYGKQESDLILALQLNPRRRSMQASGRMIIFLENK